MNTRLEFWLSQMFARSLKIERCSCRTNRHREKSDVGEIYSHQQQRDNSDLWVRSRPSAVKVDNSR